MLFWFHPAFVHFTVAFLLTGAVAEVAGMLFSRGKLERFGGLLVLGGTASLLPTVVSGYLAANTVPLPEGARSLLARHETVGLAVCAIFLVSQLWKAWHAGKIPGAGRFGYAVLVSAGAALVGYGALLGGEMVYGWGVGVLGG